MFQNIQILRGFAAHMVVLFHVVPWLPAMPEPGPLIHRIFHDWGKSSVDLFFVISGFVIMLEKSRKQQGMLSFLRNRALRILPLYWLLTFGAGIGFADDAAVVARAAAFGYAAIGDVAGHGRLVGAA